jgi:probable rRNA maturation factor
MKKAAETILSALGFIDSELSIVVVGDRSIRKLNRDYLGKDRPTNVISFAMGEGEFGGLNPSCLGDVVISADTAGREAEAASVTPHERLCLLLLHGILHLAGFDHERSGAAAAVKMNRKERELAVLLRNESLL